MIDEKKLIEELSRNSIFEKVTVGEETVYDVINRLPKAGEWIPCSERLPEDAKTTVVTLSNGEVEGAFWNGRNWWCMGDSINLETRTEDVIAWQPLPEPYKEGLE
jgi:hypothetical protein